VERLFLGVSEAFTAFLWAPEWAAALSIVLLLFILVAFPRGFGSCGGRDQSRPMPLILGGGVFVVVALTAARRRGLCYQSGFFGADSIRIGAVLGLDWRRSRLRQSRAFRVLWACAYVFSILLVRHVPLPLCFVLAGIIVATIAAALAFPLFRLQGDYFAFATWRSCRSLNC